MVANAQNLRVRIQAAKDLGVGYVRPAAAEVNNPERSRAIDDTLAAGLKIVLTVVNRPAGPRQPSSAGR